MERWVDQVKHNLPNLKIVNLSEKVNLISYKGSAELGDFQYMTKIDARKNTNYHFQFGHTHEDVMRVCFLKNDNNEKLDKVIDRAKKNMQNKGTLVKQKETIQVE